MRTAPILQVFQASKVKMFVFVLLVFLDPVLGNWLPGEEMHACFRSQLSPHKYHDPISEFPTSGVLECWEFCRLHSSCKAIVFSVFERDNCQFFDRNLKPLRLGESDDEMSSGFLIYMVQKSCVDPLTWNATELFNQSSVSGVFLRSETSNSCVKTQLSSEEDATEGGGGEEEEEGGGEEEEGGGGGGGNDTEGLSMSWGRCTTLWEIHHLDTTERMAVLGSEEYTVRIQLKGSEFCFQENGRFMSAVAVVLRPCDTQEVKQRFMVARSRTGEDLLEILTLDWNIVCFVMEVDGSRKTLTVMKLIVPPVSPPCKKFRLSNGAVDGGDLSRPFYLPGEAFWITCNPGYGVNTSGTYISEMKITCTGAEFIPPMCLQVEAKDIKETKECKEPKESKKAPESNKSTDSFKGSFLNAFLGVGMAVTVLVSVVAASLAWSYKSRIEMLKNGPLEVELSTILTP